MEHYKVQGKEYLMPGEQPTQNQTVNAKSKTLHTSTNNEYGGVNLSKQVASTKTATASTTSIPREKPLGEREVQLTEEKMKQLEADYKPGQFTKFQATLNHKDNIKSKKKKQKPTIEKLARLKFVLMKKLKGFKEEQNKIFASVPERKVINITPTLTQSESQYVEKESTQN